MEVSIILLASAVIIQTVFIIYLIMKRPTQETQNITPKPLQIKVPDEAIFKVQEAVAKINEVLRKYNVPPLSKKVFLHKQVILTVEVEFRGQTNADVDNLDNTNTVTKFSSEVEELSPNAVYTITGEQLLAIANKIQTLENTISQLSDENQKLKSQLEEQLRVNNELQRETKRNAIIWQVTLIASVIANLFFIYKFVMGG